MVMPCQKCDVLIITTWVTKIQPELRRIKIWPNIQTIMSIFHSSQNHNTTIPLINIPRITNFMDHSEQYEKKEFVFYDEQLQMEMVQAQTPHQQFCGIMWYPCVVCKDYMYVKNHNDTSYLDRAFQCVLVLLALCCYSQKKL